MEKKRFFLKGGLIKLLPVFGAFFILLVLTSCNNNGKKDDKEIEAQAINDATWYLKLPKETLIQIFSYGNGNVIKQLYFAFEPGGKNYSLEVYGYDSTGMERIGPFPLEIIKSENPIKNPNKLKRRGQIINRGSLKEFLNLATGTDIPIPIDKFIDMYFKAGVDEDPRHPGKNLMYFYYKDVLPALVAAAAAGNGATQPSPPASACEVNCDSN